ncbi:MAG: tRNA (adenosine(37)-N6)-threonylcarbamoyltransferase complex ATPase subunit type 1 TsaE [Pseudomonadota bacterium]
MAESATLSQAGTLTLRLADSDATEQFGARMGRSLVRAGLDDGLVLLDGELGAGKTTTARGLLRGLGYTGRVPSPTYTLLEPYDISGLSVSHLDLYRLADASELEHIGWRDIAASLRLVEWSSRAPGLRDAADIQVTLSLDGIARRAQITALSLRGRSVIDDLGIISP